MPEHVELCRRSAFSFLDGASLPEELVARARELGHRARALRDRDGLYGRRGSPSHHLRRRGSPRRRNRPRRAIGGPSPWPPGPAGFSPRQSPRIGLERPIRGPPLHASPTAGPYLSLCAQTPATHPGKGGSKGGQGLHIGPQVRL